MGERTIKILRLEIENFKPFKKVIIPNENEFPSGLIVIRGPNSTGKSSLFDAIIWGLWGSRRYKNDKIIRYGEQEVKVIIDFEIMNRTYRVERSYSKGFGSAVVLYELDQKNRRYRKLTSKSSSVNRKLNEIFHMDDKQALETILVQQGRVTSLATATPSELRKLIENIYNIEIFQKVDKYLLDQYKSNSIKLEDIRKRFESPERIGEDINKIKKRIEMNKKELDEVKKKLADYKTKQKQYPQLDFIYKVKDLKNKIINAYEAYEQDEKYIQETLQEIGIKDINETSKALENMEKQKHDIQEEIRSLDSIIVNLGAKARSAEENNTKLKEKIQKLKEIERVGEKKYKCPVCGSDLTEEHAKKLLNDYEQEIKLNKENITKYSKKIKIAKKKKSEAQQRERNLISKIAEVRRIVKDYKNLEDKKQIITKFEKELSKLLSTYNIKNIDELLTKYNARSFDDIIRKIQEVSNQISIFKNTIQNIEENLIQYQADLKDKEKLLRESKEMREQMKELEKITKHIDFIRRSIIKPFITNYVFERKLLRLVSSRASEYLKLFSAGQYTRVEMKVTEDNKGLIIEVHDERDKQIKTIDELSFGDKISLGLALRLGISKTMSRVRPMKNSRKTQPRIRCVLLDEPLGELDEKRRNAVIGTLLTDKSFEQIFLITHTDTGEYDDLNTIKVYKKDDASIAELILMRQAEEL